MVAKTKRLWEYAIGTIFPKISIDGERDGGESMRTYTLRRNGRTIATGSILSAMYDLATELSVRYPVTVVDSIYGDLVTISHTGGYYAV